MKIEDYIQKTADICALPDTCTRIQELLNDDTSNINDIAEVLSCDPLLTSQVLKLANSALYNFSFKVDTVSKAVTALGVKAIYDLVLITSAADTLSKLNTEMIDLDRHWRISINTALIAKRLGGQLKQADPERLFVLGLLHNIGELITCQLTPNKAANCQQYNANILPKNLQLTELGFTYAELSSEIFKTWNFPENMVNSTRLQHIPDDSLDAQLLHIASNCALISVHPDFYQIDDLIDSYLIKALGFKEKELNAAMDWANIGAFNLFSLVNPSDNHIY